MLLIKDAMVVIHLAKMTLLKDSCKYFGNVMIPGLVYNEIMAGKEEALEVNIIKGLIDEGVITVRKVVDDKYLKKAFQFNIQRGEAETVALYWQERADYLASDDNNVRQKSVLLNLNLIGTPVIVLILYRKGVISRNKFKDSLYELRKIGWFSNEVIDKILREGEK